MTPLTPLIQSNSFDVCFMSMQMNYQMFDQYMTKLDFLRQGDKLNVFLNMESIIKNLSVVKDVERKVYTSRDFDILISSRIINYAAHYKGFFKRNGLDVKVYLYMTDLESTEFNEYDINPEYRCYYLMKYMKNPKFIGMSEHLTKEIIPKVKTILEYVQDVYFINGKNIDGSLIPMIIGESDKSRKNLIISSDAVETQYSFHPNYRCFYLKRGSSSVTGIGILDFLADLTKKDREKLMDNDANFYTNKGFYLLLLSVLGDRYRSIDSIPNVAYATLTKFIKNGLVSQTITPQTTHPDLLADIFPPEIHQDVAMNYKCLNLEEMLQHITKIQSNSIMKQIVDKTDVPSLIRLNGTTFSEYRINLESLTM